MNGDDAKALDAAEAKPSLADEEEKHVPDDAGACW